MKYVIGSGANLMDFTYVGNVAQAHVLVRSQRMRTWCEPSPECRLTSGRACAPNRISTLKC